MAMRREVEEIVTRFGVVGLGDVQAAFGSTASALGKTSAAARATSGDLDRAGQASARAATAVADANRVMRESMRGAEGQARTQLSETIRQAQAREEAARKALADAQTASQAADASFKRAPSRPRGNPTFWGPQDQEVFDRKARLQAARDTARELARVKAAELADVLDANRRQIREAEAGGKELVRIARESGMDRVRAAEDALRAAREAERRAIPAPADFTRQAGRAAAQAAPVPVDPATAARLRREADAANRAARQAVDAAVKGARDARIRAARRPHPGMFPAWEQGEAEIVQSLKEGAQAATAAAREKERVAKAAEKSVQEAARETARVQAEQAARAAAAWRAQLAAMESFRKTYLPRLGLLNPLTAGVGGIGSSLVTRGLLPTAFGLGGSVLGLGGSVLGATLGVGSAAGKALTGTLGLVGRVGEGVLGIGVAAVRAGAKLAYELGAGAVSLLERLGSTAVGVGQRVLGFAKTLAVRGALMGGIAAVAAARAGQRAVSDSADNAKETLNASIDTGAGLFRYQAIAAAAKRAGVDQQELTSALQASKAAMANIAQDPALLSYFERLRVGTRMADGRLRDTQATLAELLPRIRELNGMEQFDLVSRLFGSPEAAEKIMPLIRGLTNPAFQQAALARQSFLGSIVAPDDVLRMRVAKASMSDLGDAFKGLKQTVTRAIFTDVVAALGTMANAIAQNRYRIAALAKSAIDVGKILFAVARSGTAAAGQINPMAYFGVPWFRFLVDLTLSVRRVAVAARDAGRDLAKAFNLPDQAGWFDLLGRGADGLMRMTIGAINLGREFGRAFAALQAREDTGKAQMVNARQGVVDVAAGVFYLKQAVASTVPFWRELWAAMSGHDADVQRFTWLLTVRTWASELWSTIMGRDAEVRRFPGLIAARDAFAAFGAFAKEVWYAASGQDRQVTRFPVVIAIRNALVEAYGWARDFATEFWATVSGKDAPMYGARFPWLFAARAAVLSFVEDAKAAWADLGTVWNGGSGQTSLGQWARWAIDRFHEIREGVIETVDTVKRVWSDLKQVWDHKSQPGEKFNFDWIRKAGDDVRWFAETLQKAWQIFEKIFKVFDGVVEHVSGGRLNAETLILVGTIATLLGLTRTLMGIATVAGGAWKGLGGAMAGAAAAAGGAAVVGGAAGAGGGLVAGLGATEAALATSGAAVVAATTKWGAFADKLKGVGSLLQGMGGKGALAGFVAGEAMQFMAPDNSAFGKGLATAGGALEWGATGALLGSRAGPWGALAGAAAGAAWGGYSGYSAYGARQAQQPVQAQQAAPASNALSADDPRLRMREVDVEEITRRSYEEALAREAAGSADRWAEDLRRNQDASRFLDRMSQQPRAQVGPQASAEPTASFNVVMTDGRKAKLSGLASDVAAIRNELDRGLMAPQWSTA